MGKQNIPDVVIRRLPIYLRVLENLSEESYGNVISSFELGEKSGVTPAQVRKDLSLIGAFGKQGLGYEIATLRDELKRILNLDREIKVAIIGVGNLGHAIAKYIIQRYDNEKDYHLKLVALFDSDPRVIGELINGVPIDHIDSFHDKAPELGFRMVVIAVPAEVAQSVMDKCVMAGIEAVLNFAPVHLKAPKGIRIHNTDLSIDLMHLAYYL
ncbi:MAG: redox-sensing transcriptional repressor Rex [Firmicutes bacterium]|nr:redox-sensing transcriptional repressor Rex [Bacillota bacterium]